jgi:formimidoylglutamate deiminase
MERAERAPSQLLSGFVFCEHGGEPIRDVYTGGRAVVVNGTHAQQEAALADYRIALRELLS